MRVLTPALTVEKNTLASTAAWLALVTMTVNATTVLRFVRNPANVVFRGDTYVAMAMEIEDVVQDTKGGLHDVSISVSNVTREVGAYVELHELRGAAVTILYVHSANLADPDAVVLEEQYEIMSIQVRGARTVTFLLGHDRINTHPFPFGRFLRDNCRWLYKSSECGYGGALPTCSKGMEGANGCRAHGNVPRFGGFPLLTPIPGRQL